MSEEKMDERPKIVIFACFYEPFISGAELFVKEVIKRLGQRYHFIVIAAHLDKSLPKYEKHDDYEYYRVGLGKKKDKWIYPILAGLLAKKLKPDLSHAVMESYAGIAAWFFKSWSKNTPTILTLQSGDLDDPSKKIPSWLWKRIHKAPDLITSISNALAERAKKLGVKEENLVIIPNGVDLELATKSRLEQIPGRIVCVARLSWEKGLDYLLKAMPDVIREHPDANLVMVGEGDKRTELESMIKELNLEGKVDLLGKLPHEETLAEIGKSEVFVCPSLAEGLGIVFIEAQACDVAVVGTRVGGIPDVIQHEETGLLVEPKNSEQIADALKRLLGNQDLRERLRQNAISRLDRFDWNKIVEDLSDEYNKLLKYD